MKFSKTIIATLLASALMITLSGCDNDGPMEEAGEQMDEAVEDSGEAIEDATDGH